MGSIYKQGEFYGGSGGGGSSGVTSFNGRNGSILPMAGDYDATQINYSEQQTVKQKIDALVTGVSSFNGRSGSILPIAGDYDATQVNYDSSTTVKDELDNIEDDIDGINLFTYPLNPSKTPAGITMMDNNDGTFTFNGTNNGTDYSDWYLHPRVPRNDGTDLYLPIGTYVFTIGESFSNDVVCSIRTTYNSASEVFVTSTPGSNAISFEITENTQSDYKRPDGSVLIGVAITVPATGASFTNHKFYPMIVYSKFTGIPWRPYNQQSIQHQINAQTGVLGAKNLLENTGITETVRGATFTENANGTTTITGSVSSGANVDHVLVGKSASSSGAIVLPSSIVVGQRYIASCQGIEVNNKLRMLIYFWDNNANQVRFDCSGPDYEFTVPITATKWMVEICAFAPATISGSIVAKPMIRRASDPDDTYVPYAMTNRELTPTKNTLPATTDGNGYAYSPLLATNVKVLSPYYPTKIVTPFVNGAGYWVFKVMNPDGTIFANSAVEIVYFTQPV